MTKDFIYMHSRRFESNGNACRLNFLICEIGNETEFKANSRGIHTFQYIATNVYKLKINAMNENVHAKFTKNPHGYSMWRHGVTILH